MTPLLLALVLASPAALKRSPKPDDRATYSMRALIDLGGKDDVRFTGTFTERVKSVEGDVLTTSFETKVSVDLMGVVRESRAIASDRVERLDGTLTKPEAVDSTLLFGVGRVDRLRAFYFPPAPVEVGASWWHTEAAREDPKAPPFSSYLKLEGEEKLGKRDVWRASLDANEADDASPVHVKGMVWLDKADGSLVRGQWTINGFSYSPTAPAINARYELSRTD